MFNFKTTTEKVIFVCAQFGQFVTVFLLTFISTSPALVVDLKIGRPTNAGKICAGKFEPPNPHFTNCKCKTMLLFTNCKYKM